jgi:hypothetical protein
MAFEPQAVAYAFIDSFLTGRESKWGINLAEITLENLDEKVTDKSHNDKIRACLDSIIKINNVPANNTISLIYSFAKQAKAQHAKAPTHFLFWQFSQYSGTLHTAIQALYIEKLKGTDEFKLKVDDLDSKIKHQEALLKAANADEQVVITKTLEELKEQRSAYDVNNQAHIEFFNKWVSCDAQASKLNEKTWEDFLRNVESGARVSPISTKFATRFTKKQPDPVEAEKLRQAAALEKRRELERTLEVPPQPTPLVMQSQFAAPRDGYETRSKSHHYQASIRKGNRR